MRAVIWGAGGVASNFLIQKVLYSDYVIEAIIDNDKSKWGSDFFGYRVVSPDNLPQIDPDAIIICSLFENEISEQIKDICVANEINMIVLSYKDMNSILISKILERNIDSKDAEIVSILDAYKKDGFSVYGSYKYDKERYAVYRDSDMMPYIMFEGKRMYYPRDRVFKEDPVGEYVEDVLKEQQADSPHLYLRPNKSIVAGAVVVDAGVCEGNFALRYISDASKMYLIEADPKWIEPLERSFRPFKDKVVLCNKYLSDEDTDDSVTLDGLVSEKIDFLKMDIEGAELAALRGAEYVLKTSDAECAICSYHRFGDEVSIREILREYGYSTSTSTGYMFFTYDDNMIDTMDFRRGIVYGDKR